MSVTSVSNRWLNRLYKILAILLVLLAVLISAFRLLLPYVEHYREEFQDYVNEANNTNIVIGQLGMSWQQWGPTIVSKQVTFVDKDDALVFIEHIEMQIDFWESISRQRLVSSNIVLDGAQLVLSQGVWNTDGDRAAKVDPKELSGFDQISSIFLNRVNQFTLRNSHILIYNNDLKRNFHISNLHWKNSGARHQAQGKVIVDELSTNNLNLQIDLIGDSVDELKGQMYLEANHLDITPWLDKFLALDNDKTKTDIGFSTWLKVDGGQIERLQVALAENHISWQDAHGANNLSLSQGQFLLVKGKAPQSFKLFSTPLQMKFNEQAEQEYIVQINKTAEGFSVYLSAFDLALISQLSPLFINEQTTQNLFSQLNIVGNAQDIYFRKYSDDFQAVANFTEASTLNSDGIPGIKNLSGELSFSDKALHLDLSATDGALDFDKLFVAPIVYDSFNAKVALDFTSLSENKSGWQLKVDDIEVLSPELTLNADLSMYSEEGSELTMALLASITNGDASKAGHYFPLTTMSENLVDYLNNALVKGNIAQAQVLINGPLAHFPYTDHSGIFVVDAELEQGIFDFASDWPNITNFAANLNFTNNSMLITGRDGTLVGLEVAGMQASIDDLANEQILTVDTVIQPVSAVLVENLMVNSPLKESVGAVLEQLKVSGDVQGEFHLNLPLQDTEQVLASGLINFSDNTMALQQPSMDFANINGQLIFANEKITTKDLSLTWLEMPLSLDITGVNKAEYYDTDIAIVADWDDESWQPNVIPLLSRYSEGKVQWQGDLSLHQHHNSGFSYTFDINSELEQAIIKLPTPYRKTQGDKVPLKVEVNGLIDESTINVTYGEQLSFFGVLEHESTHFERSHLVLGDEKMLLPMDGFHITTKLPYADFAHWQPLITEILDSVKEIRSDKPVNESAEQSTNLFSTPERIRGTIGELDILGQQLNNVSFNLLDQTNWWLLQLNAKETRSRIKFYPDWLEQGIDVNSDFINFSADTTEQPESDDVTPQTSDDDVFANVPKMNFYCERCRVDKIDLGEVKFSLSRDKDNIINIENFIAKREQAEFTLSGQWLKEAESYTTNINGALMLKDIEYEMEQLGYVSSIRDSGGKLDFTLSWEGGPHDLNLVSLDGELSSQIDDGYLAQVSDKARIFSILSLESLVRKLTLDFRDIFSDGMFYSDIKGDYRVKNGILYTANTRMNGTAGNLYIKGNTNFVTDELDYQMTYKPNLTSSLPVLAWIATLNPVVFLAGVAIDQVITSQVVSEFNFELTGSIEDPNFKEVNRKSRDISVGTSTPPEFVDNTESNTEDLNKKEQDKNELDPQSLQQYQPSENIMDLSLESNHG